MNGSLMKISEMKETLAKALCEGMEAGLQNITDERFASSGSMGYSNGGGSSGSQGGGRSGYTPMEGEMFEDSIIEHIDKIRESLNSMDPEMKKRVKSHVTSLINGISV